ncbi:unnamed protein product [Rotaria sp. Silwood1]|nr:unnamed protein product [Rotaria sp. Silwood1]CAF3367182.1 unnamed protein product [Rotaria sp. Silwood1]CAF3398006.1 unnamed protein product [Rotaria sp. Silwood1]CAF4638544.1 unnamed protein product [Rotaria sp. Silwood1]CAF4704154.1 unnamed protein product [Rotaria sp. Silwood1]
MNRPLFRARNLDPSKRIRLLVDQHDDNNNTLTNSSSTTTTTATQSSSSNNFLVSYSSTSNLQTSQQTLLSNSQRCVPQMPFVSGMEREEESEYHLQNALDAQRRLGSAKIRAVPIPDLYEDPNSQSIYPAINQLPKQLIRLQPLQLESDEPEYDMDRIDHDWFNEYGRLSCPNLTYLEYEIIIDKLENASTRTLISFDEARTLLSNIDEIHLKNVYDFWHKRRTTRDKRLKARLLTERDIKEEKGKHHPYVAFRRRVEKMTTRKNRKNDEQAYLSMLKLRSNFEAVVKLTSLIKTRETIKASLLECALTIFQARCDSKPDDEISSTTTTTTSSTNTSITQPTNHDRHSHHHHHHARSNLKTSSLLNSNSSLLTTQHQQLLTQLIRMDNHKKNSLSSSTLASLLQTPIQSQQIRTLSNDSNECLQPKLKRFKASDSSINNTTSSKKFFRKLNHTDKLTQLLSSPTTPTTPIVHNLALPPSTSIPQSILERLSPGNIFTSQLQQQQSQQSGRRRSKNSLSGTIKQGKNHRNLPLADLWSLTENSSNGTILLKAQLLEATKKMQQKDELENNINRRVILQDGSSILSTSNENINNSFDGIGTSIDDDESIDPWQFRPKVGCRYLRPIDQDQQQHTLPRRSTFSSFYYVACSERGHIGKRRVRLGRGGRLLYDRHIEQENKDLTDETFLSSHITDKYVLNQKPVLWRLSSRPLLKESYRLHSYLTVNNHTMSLAHHYQSKSSNNSSIYLNNSSYDINNTLTLNTNDKNPSSFSIELDHPYSCSSRHINQTLSTLTEPQPPSPSSPPPLSSTNSISTSQQMMLISTPPTPPPSSTINNHDIDISKQEQTEQQQQQHQIYTKSSSTFVLSPTTPVFPSHHPSYVIPSTPPPSSSVPTKQTPSSCGLVQLVQLHRIHAPTKTHKFASSTPVTTSDS